MSSLAHQTAQDETSSVTRLHNAVSYVLRATPTELKRLSEHDHKDLLETACEQARNKDPDALEAAYRLLYNVRYPDAVELADQRAAMAFAAEWRIYARTWEPISTQEKKPAKELYRDSCLIALKTLGLADNVKDISFETCAFEEEKVNAGSTPPPMQRDFIGIASAQTEKSPNGVRVILRTNADVPLWMGSYEPASRIGREIARVGMHETSHVDQPIRQASTPSDPFYRRMGDQARALRGLKHIFRVYRCGLEERQAYLRDRYVEAILEDGRLRAERDIMDTHLHEENMRPFVEDGCNNLLEMIGNGSLDELLPTRQSMLKKIKKTGRHMAGRLLDL